MSNLPIPRGGCGCAVEPFGSFYTEGRFSCGCADTAIVLWTIHDCVIGECMKCEATLFLSIAVYTWPNTIVEVEDSSRVSTSYDFDNRPDLPDAKIIDLAAHRKQSTDGDKL